jgi:hypothetical protein
MKPTLKEQMEYLERMAHKRHLKIRKDKRLTKTPYTASNPQAAKYLGIPCVKNCISLSPRSERPLRRKVQDTRHELLELGKMNKGWSYHKAHLFANRFQRTPGSVK